MIISLKDEKPLWGQYVKLRNKYRGILQTKRVNLDETSDWISKNYDNLVMLGYVEGSELLGVVILYKHKDNEVCIFVKNKGEAIATKLMLALENEHRGSLRAWCAKTNIPAINLFLKFGYIYSHSSFKGKVFGSNYTKKI